VGLLAGPDHALHDSAVEIFRRVADGALRLIVTPIVVAELVYVTRSLFTWTRRSTAERLGSLLEADGLTVTERTVVARALQLYLEHLRLDFADAYLAAIALEVGPAAVTSFDADLDAVKGIRRIST
jgi:predicted nucleic acid-binding protein